MINNIIYIRNINQTSGIFISISSRQLPSCGTLAPRLLKAESILSPYELFIGLRYTRAKKRNHFISFISMISMLGIALGVAALIIVLSVMNGFQKEIRARILGVTPHLQVASSSGSIAEWQPIEKIVATHPKVQAAAPYITGQGMLSQNENVQGVMVRGILPEQENRLTQLSDKMKTGKLESLRAGEFGIVLGVDLARSLGARVGESILLITPQCQITPAGMCHA